MNIYITNVYVSGFTEMLCMIECSTKHHLKAYIYTYIYCFLSMYVSMTFHVNLVDNVKTA